MGTTREQYSHFGFFTALPAQDYDGVAANGPAIDLRGYGTATIIVTVGSFVTAGSVGVSNFDVGLQHAGTSAAGMDAFADVTCANVVHSTYGSGGTAMTSGWFYSIASDDQSGAITAIGYIAGVSTRYIRVKTSITGAADLSCGIGAVVIAGSPHAWPVREVAGR